MTGPAVKVYDEEMALWYQSSYTGWVFELEWESRQRTIAHDSPGVRDPVGPWRWLREARLAERRGRKNDDPWYEAE